MAKRRGYATLIYVDINGTWTKVAGQRSADMSRGTETVDLNSKDEPKWDTKGHGRLTWQLSCDGVVVANDTAYAALEAAWKGQKLVKVRTRRVENGTAVGELKEGYAIITDLSESEPDGGEASTYSVTLEGKGELSKLYFVDDFSRYPIGAGAPEGWSPVWNTDGGDWEIVKAIGGKILINIMPIELAALKYDNPNSITDGHMVAKISPAELVDVAGCRAGVILRGGYFASVENAGPDEWQLTLERCNPSTGVVEAVIDTYEIPGTGTPDWFWVKLECVGTAIRARIWDDGTDEPDTWDIDETDATYASGFAGVAINTNQGFACVIYDVVKIQKY